MKFNPEIHHRRSIRLTGYDYSKTGAYFVTICPQNGECLFGDIVGANGIRPEMILNEYGKMVQDEWLKSGEIRLIIELDEFVVMPNHFHGIVMINRTDDELDRIREYIMTNPINWNSDNYNPLQNNLTVFK